MYEEVSHRIYCERVVDNDEFTSRRKHGDLEEIGKVFSRMPPSSQHFQETEDGEVHRRMVGQ